MERIDTGYKPEFALGALYQGENAANAEMENQLNFIKQFLTNQRQQQMMPIDVAQAQQNLDSTAYKTTPEFQTGMRDTISGQGMSNLAAGQTASALQPFKQKLGQAEAQNQLSIQDKINQVQQLDNLIQTEQNPLQRIAQMKARNDLLGMLKESPEFIQKRELKETGTESAEYIAELRAAAARQAAEARAHQGGTEKLTAEQAAVRSIIEQLNANKITPKVADEKIWELYNRKTEKPPQSGITAEMGPDGNMRLVDKPTNPRATPPSATVIKYDSQGNRIQ